jgi:hypothetical protein
VDGPVVADVHPGFREHLLRLQLDVVALGLFAEADHAYELDFDPRLLHDLADRGVLDGLALLKPSARDDCAELGIAWEVEDEQLVGPRLRVLARDVRRDWRPRPQLC